MPSSVTLRASIDFSCQVSILADNMTKKSQQFRVIIEQDEDGYFVASVPALPGCYTQSKTLPELKKRIREAILLCLDVARSDREYRKRLAIFSYQPNFVGLETVEV